MRCIPIYPENTLQIKKTYTNRSIGIKKKSMSLIICIHLQSYLRQKFEKKIIYYMYVSTYLKRKISKIVTMLKSF